VQLCLEKTSSLVAFSGARWDSTKSTALTESSTRHFQNRVLLDSRLVQLAPEQQRLLKFSSQIISSQHLIRSLTRLQSLGIAQETSLSVESLPLGRHVEQSATEPITTRSPQRHTSLTLQVLWWSSLEAQFKLKDCCFHASELQTRAFSSSLRFSIALQKRRYRPKTMRFP
jgi:hypothetical protein